MKSRRLTDREIDLWLSVVRTVVPRPEASVPRRAAAVATKPEPKTQPPAEPSRRFAVPSYSPPVSSPGKTVAAAFDLKYRRKVAGGRIEIDDSLDLHGMSQAKAHGALLGFLVRAQARDARLVLVVTGKGRIERQRPDGSAEAGVLRRAVPHWLNDPALRGIVLGFEAAARPHGGTGALYVRLRRRPVEP